MEQRALLDQSALRDLLEILVLRDPSDKAALQAQRDHKEMLEGVEQRALRVLLEVLERQALSDKAAQPEAQDQLATQEARGQRSRVPRERQVHKDLQAQQAFKERRSRALRDLRVTLALRGLLEIPAVPDLKVTPAQRDRPGKAEPLEARVQSDKAVRRVARVLLATRVQRDRQERRSREQLAQRDPLAQLALRVHRSRDLKVIPEALGRLVEPDRQERHSRVRQEQRVLHSQVQPDHKEILEALGLKEILGRHTQEQRVRQVLLETRERLDRLAQALSERRAQRDQRAKRALREIVEPQDRLGQTGTLDRVVLREIRAQVDP